MLFMVSHDLKTPLNVILGVAEALQDTLRAQADLKDRDEVAEGLDTIVAMGGDMARLIDGLLSSARIESGKERLEFTEVTDLAGILGTITGVFQREARRRRIDLRLRLAAPLPTVHWDICRIQYHVLNNILSNALKYTPDGGTVELRAQGDQERVVIEIADNGPGIPREERAKVFHRFERLGVQAERAYQSSGLGLYNANLLARQHGGAIRIGDGLDGRGVTFSVELPVVAEAAAGD
ncbi:sensor histidine kinase [Methylogaea oryzae]|uniref:histidine kinase n=1 Tax=Methylogaea oryzae TaxID=1295382 RepID=A0A8D5AIH9_9GAMM|nr:HAMP domain-containing sensor histidine kinase [Methylogaea oryzae]BBL71366.1 hypothetical protein MoryE10_19720 [Methylogaea oryzae]